MSVHPIAVKSGSPPGGGEPLLPDDRIEGIRSRLRKHLDDSEDVSQTKVAKKTGYSVSTLSLFLGDTYNGDVSGVARAVETYLNLYAQKSSVALQPRFVKTSVATKIERAIFMAKMTSGISVIATQSGVGATWALRDHIRKYPMSISVECSPDIGTKWALLTELLQIFGKENRRPAFARRAIVESLTGTDRTILVDEAHYLTQECVDVLRRIHDQAEVALVLAGNESVYEGFRSKANGGESRGMAAMSYTQLRGRLAARLVLRSADITQHDIRLVAMQMVDAEVVDAVLPQLRGEALNNGGLRRVVRIMQVAQMLASAKNGGGVKKGHVFRAIDEIKELGGGDE